MNCSFLSSEKSPVPEIINGSLKFDNKYLNDYQMNYFPDSVKKLDGEYGRYGFVKKGTTDVSSHVNQDGQSDSITIDIDTVLKPILNAGYAEAIVVTGVKMNATNWLVYITLTILLGVAAKRIISLRKKEY